MAPDTLGVLLQFAVYGALAILTIVATTLLALRWEQARRHFVSGVLWCVVLGVWGAVVGILYRAQPPIVFVSLFLMFAMHAVVQIPIWPVARALMEEDRAARRWGWPATIGASVLTAALAGAVTFALFSGVDFKIPDYAVEFEKQLLTSRAGMMLLVVGAAVYEELVFRLGFFVFLRRAFRRVDGHGIAAIVVSSLLWAFAHAGAVEPAWLKYLQIFIFGVFQCVLFGLTRRIEAPILTHALFNAGVVAIGWSAT